MQKKKKLPNAHNKSLPKKKNCDRIFKWTEIQSVCYMDNFASRSLSEKGRETRATKPRVYTTNSTFPWIPAAAKISSKFFFPPYNTLPALAGMVVSMELVAAAAAAMFLPAKLVRKLVVV